METVRKVAWEELTALIKERERLEQTGNFEALKRVNQRIRLVRELISSRRNSFARNLKTW